MVKRNANIDKRLMGNKGKSKKKKKVAESYGIRRKTRSSKEDSSSSDSESDDEVNKNTNDVPVSKKTIMGQEEATDAYGVKKVRIIQDRQNTEATGMLNVGTIVTVNKNTNEGSTKDDVSKMGTTVSSAKSVEEQYDSYKLAISQALKRFIRKRFIKDFKFCNKEIAEVVVEECHRCNELRILEGMAWETFLKKTTNEMVPRLFNDCRHTIQSAIRSKYLSK